MADMGVTEMLALASTAATVGGTVISAAGAERQAEATAQANNYNAQVAANNQIIAKQYADASLQQGEQLAQQKQMETAQRQGAIAAVVGASGMDPSGTSLRLSADTQAMGALDVATIRSNAAKAAYGYNVQGMNYGAQAGLDMAAARDAKNAGFLSSVGSVISGSGMAADKWLKYSQAGIV